MPTAVLPDKTCLVGREDARVQLYVSRLVNTVHVSEGSSDAEVRGDRSQGLLHSPDLTAQIVHDTAVVMAGGGEGGGGYRLHTSDESKSR